MGEGAVVKNAASGKQVRRGRKIDRDEELLLAADMDVLMNRQDFRRFVARFLDEANFFGNAFGHDDRNTSFNLGKQFMGQKLAHEARTHNPAGWDLMQREEQVDQQSKEYREPEAEEATGEGALTEEPIEEGA